MPLYYAVEKRDDPVVGQPVKEGARVSAKDSFARRPPDRAVENRHLSVARLFVDT